MDEDLLSTPDSTGLNLGSGRRKMTKQGAGVANGSTDNMSVDVTIEEIA